MLTLNEIKRHIRALPERMTVDRSVRLYSLCSLLWIYVDTVCDMSAIRRDPRTETRRACRKLRELHREYDSFRLGPLTSEGVREETKRAEMIDEELCGTRLAAHRRELAVRLERFLEMDSDARLYFVAVHLARAMYDAVLTYSGRVTKELEAALGLDLPLHTFLAEHVLPVGSLLRQMTPPNYVEWRDISRRTVLHVVKRITEIEIIIEEESKDEQR